MWKATDLGVAIWSDEHGDVVINARGGETGIAIAVGDATWLQICAVDDDSLPVVDEQFIKTSKEGDAVQWHLNFPQGQSRFALRMTLIPIESSPDRLVLEACISVQTDLLDSHPKLDLQIDCHQIESLVPQDEFGKDDVMGSGSAAISTAIRGDQSASIILGTHDQPWTTNHSTDRTLRLRLFGDFLEKGVIRRARPWIVLDRGKRATGQELEQLWATLCESPLPLT